MISRARGEPFIARSNMSEEVAEAEKVEIVLDQGQREDVEERTKEAEEYLAGFEDFQIEDDDDLEVAVECLKEVKTNYKKIKAEQELATKPMNSALRQVRSWFKPALVVLESTERLLKGKVAAYHLRLEEQSRRAMEEAAAASAAGDFDGAHEASKGIVAAPQSKGVSITRHWDYVVEDPDQVPRQFLTVDHSAVKIHIKGAGKEMPDPIPGIRFEEKTRTAVRTG